MEHLLPRSVATTSHLWPLVQSQPHGPACLSVFVGINCSAKDLNIIHKQNAWVYTDNDIDKVRIYRKSYIYLYSNYYFAWSLFSFFVM